MASVTGSTNTSFVAKDSDSISLTSASSKNESTKSDQLGKDAFMQLLVTQMKYQDPLNPMDNSEMLAQLAQFTALEQMMNVAQASQKQLANGMVGKYVEYLYTDANTGTSEYRVGKVDYVKMNGETPQLGIGEIEVDLDKVYQVYDSDNIETSTSAFEMIGKTVQASITEKNAKGETVKAVIEGEVKGVKMVDGKPQVIIGTGKTQVKIPYENVQNVVEKVSVTGKKVTGTYLNDENERVTLSGTVDYIKVTSEGTYLYINDQVMDFNDVDTIE